MNVTKKILRMQSNEKVKKDLEPKLIVLAKMIKGNTQKDNINNNLFQS